MDKIPRKLRPFLDDTLKYKHRLAALLAFLDGSTHEVEVQKTFRDLAEEVVTFVLESQNYFFEKLNVDKEYYARFTRALGRGDEKEVQEIYKVPYLIEKVFRYLRDELLGMDRFDQIVNITRTLLHPGNDPMLRKFGVGLLMLWLRDHDSLLEEGESSFSVGAHDHSGEFEWLFAAIIPLSEFFAGIVSVRQPHFPLVHDEEPPIFSPVSSITAKEQAILLFTEILDFITFDINADRRSTLRLYMLLRKYYLIHLYPEACRRAGLLDNNGSVETITADAEGQLVDADSSGGSRRTSVAKKSLYHQAAAPCPVAIQTILMRYFAIWTVQSPELFDSMGSSLSRSAGIPVATFILHEILTSSREDIEIIHEVIAQSLQLPPPYKPIVKIAFSVLRTWLFNTRERRPLFLTEDQSLDQYVKLYIVMVSKVFVSSCAALHAHDQIELYKEGIYFYRGLTMKAFFNIGSEAQDALLNVMLTLCEIHLPPTAKMIDNAELVEEFAHLLVETLFGVWIRAGEHVKPSAWERLSVILGKCTTQIALIHEWSTMMMELTNMLASVMFSDMPAREADRGKRQLRSGMFEGPMPPAGSILSRSLPIDSTGLTGSGLMASLSSPLNPVLGALITSTSKSALFTASERKSDNFLAWHEIAWVRENIVFLWRNMLRSLGDVNLITDAENHRIVVGCLVTITEKLICLRDNQPYLWRPLPPIFECVVPLFQACDLPSKPFEQSRFMAYTTLCKLFCRRHDLEVPEEFCTRFYLALIKGLSDKDDPVSSIIIVNTPYLFNRELYGSTVLIPSFLRCIAAYLNTNMGGDLGVLLVPMIRIICHIAILADVYPELEVPRIEAPLAIMPSMPLSLAGMLSLSSIRIQCKQFLRLCDQQKLLQSDVNVHSVFLNSVTLLLINELVAVPEAKVELIDEYLNLLLDHLGGKDSDGILPIIIDELYALSLVGELSHDRKALVLQRMTDTVHEQLVHGSVSAELSAKLIGIILEWIMSLPHTWLDERVNLRTMIFNMLEEALLVQRQDEPPQRMSSYEVAEFALMHLQHYLKNDLWADTSFWQEIDRNAEEHDEIVYFTIGEISIVAMQKCKDRVRLLLRNAAGRFAWETKLFFDPNPRAGSDEQVDSGDARPKDYTIVDGVEPYRAAPTTTASSPQGGEGRGHKVLPVYDGERFDLEHTDMLRELFGYLREEHPEIVATQLEDPMPTARIESIAAQCEDQMEKEKERARMDSEGSLTRPNDADDNISNVDTPRQSSQATGGSLPPYHYCKLLLDSFGLLDLDSSTMNKGFCVLAKTAGMVRDLKGLDDLHTKEVIKIGVIYVAPGQEEEASILRNGQKEASESYKTFLRLLGWRVNLNRHAGYNGGLESEMTVGGEAVYYASSTVECIFHDATSILLDERDTKFIAKKRHIGNDYVHIVWNEHYRDYRPNSIRTDFGNAQIIITPMPAGLYTINISREASVGVFGPLLDGVVVPGRLLGLLVRSTAINAYRAVLKSLGRPASHPMQLRAKDLSLIVKRHAQSTWTMEQFYQYIMMFGKGAEGGGGGSSEETASETTVGQISALVETMQMQ